MRSEIFPVLDSIISADVNALQKPIFSAAKLVSFFLCKRKGIPVPIKAC